MRRKIIYSDNASLVDISTELENYASGLKTLSIIAAEDAIYIGSYLPFNHIYFKLGATVNAETSSMTIQVWDNSWVDVAELIDETASSGATLSQSGFVTWVTDKDESWTKDDTDDMTSSGLSSLKIYDRYWVKITFSADLTDNLVIQWAGNLFSNDDDLGAQYPELNRSSVLSAFESGKTEWQEQHVSAAEYIIKDLRSMNTIITGDQILDRYDLKLASVHKTASIIFNNFGDDYERQTTKAEKDYIRALKTSFPKRDINKNARVDTYEQKFMTGRLYR